MSVHNPCTIILLAVVLGGCGSPSIGVRTDFQKGDFKIGETKKSSVVDFLGLPQNILKDDQGLEHFFYPGGRQLVGTCIGCGNVNASTGIIPYAISEARTKNGAEYVFDANDVLVAKTESAKKRKASKKKSD